MQIIQTNKGNFPLVKEDEIPEQSEVEGLQVDEGSLAHFGEGRVGCIDETEEVGLWTHPEDVISPDLIVKTVVSEFLRLDELVSLEDQWLFLLS